MAVLGATASPPKNVSAADISLTINAGPGKKVPRTAFLWRIDDNSTRARGLWEEMGRPHDPTPAQMAALHAASEMKAEELEVSAAGKAQGFQLPPYAVAIVRFNDAKY